MSLGDIEHHNQNLNIFKMARSLFYQDEEGIITSAVPFHQLSNISQSSTMCLTNNKQALYR